MSDQQSSGQPQGGASNAEAQVEAATQRMLAEAATGQAQQTAQQMASTVAAARVSAVVEGEETGPILGTLVIHGLVQEEEAHELGERETEQDLLAEARILRRHMSGYGRGANLVTDLLDLAKVLSQRE
ncbi:hypothetical protein HK104_002287, partial [Borealophlyctis nickersoniae]